MLPSTVAVLRTIRPANRRAESTSEGAASAISGDWSRSVTVVAPPIEMRSAPNSIPRSSPTLLDDVLDGLISAETAERDYGVVIVSRNQVDAAATESARAARWS